VAYELFERSSIRVDTPVLSVLPAGRLGLNAAACRLLKEADVKTVVILWDKANNKMAIKAASKDQRNAFSVSFGSDSHGTLTIKSFLQHIGWHAPERQSLPTMWNATEKMFEVTLPAKYLGAEAKTPRKRRFI
jgi:hypothetical protein